MSTLHIRAAILMISAATLLLVSAPDARVGAQPFTAADVEAQRVVTIDSQGVPMMPGQRTFKTGTGKIRGRVVSAETGQPVRRVQVRLMGQEVAPKAMMTDADGRYEFTELPAGRFTVSATKSGFVTVQYGQTRPFESGKPIELADAQVIEKADIVMPRGSVIAGRIVDEFGEPVTDAMVTAMRSVWSGGRRRLQAAGRGAQTNDLGQYRIFGLPPGDYYVSATLRGGEMMMVEMAAAAVVAGGSAQAPASGYAPTYYPGTTTAPDAQRVRLALGQEVGGTDFALAPVKLARVSGTVFRSDGRPAGGTMVNLIPRLADNLFVFLDRGGRTDPNGNFTIPGVAPGDYTLQVRGMNVTTFTSEGGNRMMFSTRITEGGATEPGTEPEFGSMPVTVAGEEVSNVVVVTTKGATASGRVTFEGATQPASLTGIRVMAATTDGEPTIVFPGVPGATQPGGLQADGSFDLRGLAGPRLLRVMGLPPGWSLKSVTVEGQDATDTGFDFKPGAAVTGIDVVVTNTTTEINGTVTTASGQPVKDYTLVVFADDPAKWVFPQTRHVTAARPDQDGRVKIRNLPAGDYLAIAVEYLAQGEWGDPEVLERLKGKATSLTLQEGETETLVLKLQLL